MNIANLLPAKLQRYSKAIVALLGSVAGYIAYAYADASWAGVVLSLLTVLGVYHANNAPVVAVPGVIEVG